MMAKDTERKSAYVIPEVNDDIVAEDCNENSSQEKRRTKVNKRHQITLEIPSLPVEDIPFGKVDLTESIDDLVRKNTIDSDRDYRRITEKIIEIRLVIN